MRASVEKTALAVKRLLSLLFHVCGVRAAVNRIIRRYHGKGHPVLVLCYHGIDEHQLPAFQKQLDYLISRGYRFLSAGALLERAASAEGRRGDERTVCLTFDDCLENNYTIVRPLLKRYAVPAVFFAPSSLLGKRARWDGCEEKVMSTDQLKDMADSFEIGAHTRSHAALDRLGVDALREEIAGSRDELEGLLGREIAFFAYPHGGYTRQAVDEVRRSRYRAAFTIEQHLNYGLDERFTLGRYIVGPEDGMTFRMKVNGGYDWFFYARKIMTLLGSGMRSGRHIAVPGEGDQPNESGGPEKDPAAVAGSRMGNGDQ